ncbi:hypothetical protein KJ632_03525 [Patescibacteria group bacterium]|nr:hypothetical protein [Patescibacteria group bacterium]
MNIKNYILELLFPTYCIGCGKAKFLICADCLAGLKMSAGLGKIFYCFSYKNTPLVRKIIKQFKYKFNVDIALVLGVALKDLFLEALKKNPELYNATIVPVPIHKKRLKYRGFNQAGILALSLYDGVKSEGRNGLNFAYMDCLIRQKFEEVQANLGRDERIKNLRGAIGLKKGANICGRVFVLVDDVYTTGATTGECKKVLVGAGAKKVFVFCVAKS